MSPFLEVIGIRKSFQGIPALKQVDFALNRGEILCILGPSGCGKTTLLRIIAGIESPDDGSVRIEGRDMSDVPAHMRHVGMVFQDFALFPHLNVRENVAFGLHGLSREASLDRVRQMLERMGIEALAERRTNELSGGQKQRVALARSLAPQPRLLLLDEPLGSLDRQLRERLVYDTADVLRKLGMTAVYVTHDHAEAFAVADRVAVLQSGKIAQIGSPETVYRRPATIEIARFFGYDNVIRGRILSRQLLDADFGRLQTDTAVIGKPGDEVTVLIRPDAAVIVKEGATDPEHVNRISGTLVRKRFLGSQTHIDVRTDSGQVLSFHVPACPSVSEVGATIHLVIHPEAVVTQVS
ncbi:MAG: ABC transporter ATP-binding protein [Thermodesulfobacteriota bacterium]